MYDCPFGMSRKSGTDPLTINILFYSGIDKWAIGLIFSLPIMGQQLRARAKRKRRIRQIRNKEDAVKAAAPKAKAKK